MPFSTDREITGIIHFNSSNIYFLGGFYMLHYFLGSLNWSHWLHYFLGSSSWSYRLQYFLSSLSWSYRTTALSMSGAEINTGKPANPLSCIWFNYNPDKAMFRTLPEECFKALQAMQKNSIRNLSLNFHPCGGKMEETEQTWWNKYVDIKIKQNAN